jgi:mono/diheme cytochrome c family protein
MKATPLLLLLPVFVAACEAVPEDKQAVVDRYLGHFTGKCNSWVTSPVSGHTYCSSPPLPFSTDAAYAAAMPTKADESAFAGFETKSADEKKTLLVGEGEKVFKANCVACHQAGGTGLPPSFPPLVNDPVVNGGAVEDHIKTVLGGLSGKTINGVAYTGAMTPFAGSLTDNQIAAVITYERNSWGNNGGVVEPAQVAALRSPSGGGK